MPFIPLHDDTPRYLIARPWTVWCLIPITALCFLIQMVSGSEGGLRLIYGLGVIPATLSGEAQLADELVLVDPVVTLLSHQFLHGDFMHLFGNMLFLWVFGDNVEDAMGHVRFLIFYLLCGALAGLAQLLVDPASTTPLIGASGAISGILGAYLILHPKAKVLVPVIIIPLYLPAWLLLIFWFGFQFFALANGGDSNVAWWAHIGGFIAGAALIPLFRYRAVPLFGLGDPPGGVTLRRGVGWQPRNGGRRGPWG
ncbi:rhomboid family intramembrane serine protease [Pelagibius sp.]|uniref:rhomboid family intramembrane serine protease n=1 Tax=Pelagibius sp. TaxID=1931238 RepID=UPI003BB17849